MARIHFSYNGKQLAAEEGMTVAEALKSNRIRPGARSMRLRVWRDEYHPFKEVPSAWVCVDGIANVNAYRVRVAEGMRVTQQTRRSLLSYIGRFSGTGFYYRNFTRSEYARNFFFERVKRINDYGGPLDPEQSVASSVRELEFSRSENISPDVLVIGAGRAGLAALMALDLPEGSAVLLVDALPRHAVEENLSQLLLDLKAAGLPPDSYGLAETTTLDSLLHARNATLLESTTVFGAFEGGEFSAVSGYAKIVIIRPKTTVLCTGSEEVKPVFPKNDIPGVITSRTLLSLPQRLTRGRKMPLLYLETPLSTSYLARVAAVIMPLHIVLGFEAGDEYRSALSSVFGPAAEIVTGRPRRAYGTSVVETLSVSLHGGGRRQFAADTVVLAGRKQPRAELAILLSLNCRISTDTHVPVPVTSESMGCAQGIYACGSLIFQDSLQSVASALAAGESISAASGMLARRSLSQSIHTAASQPPAEMTPDAGGHDPKAVVCPCLDVTVGDMRRLFSEGYDTINRMRRFSGLFMGPCQGARCYRNVYEEFVTLSEKGVDLPTVRPPVAPVYLGALALTDIPIEEEKK